MDDAAVPRRHWCQDNLAVGILHLLRHLVRHFDKPFLSAFPVALGVNKNPPFYKRGFINNAIEESFNSIKRLPVLPDEERRTVGADIEMRAALNKIRFDFGINPHPVEQLSENCIGCRRDILLNCYSNFGRFRAEI